MPRIFHLVWRGKHLNFRDEPIRFLSCAALISEMRVFYPLYRLELLEGANISLAQEYVNGKGTHAV